MPAFTSDDGALRKVESLFLLNGGRVTGTFRHLDDSSRELLLVDAMSTEAQTTSENEGEILDRSSVQSSIRRELGLPGATRRGKPSERGIAELVTSLHRTFAEPLSGEMLFRWHAMAMSGRRDLKRIGGYREHAQQRQPHDTAPLWLGDEPAVARSAPNLRSI